MSGERIPFSGSSGGGGVDLRSGLFAVKTYWGGGGGGEKPTHDPGKQGVPASKKRYPWRACKARTLLMIHVMLLLAWLWCLTLPIIPCRQSDLGPQAPLPLLHQVAHCLRVQCCSCRAVGKDPLQLSASQVTASCICT